MNAIAPSTHENMSKDPAKFEQACEDYRRVEKALLFLDENAHRRPELDEVARQVRLSKYHFQRMFSRWVGISPARFLQYMNKEYARRRLLESRNVLDAALDAGLSGPGRLHDLLVVCDAVTPGELKNRGVGLDIHYGLHATPLGECLLAVTKRGICNLFFITDAGRDSAIAELNDEWSGANIIHDPKTTAPMVERIFAPKKSTGATLSREPLHLLLKGTNFQIKVWEALLRIPSGALLTYGDVAELMGEPSAVRAAASAIARNPIAYLIPCHRVIRKLGVINQYRWGEARKKVMIAYEGAVNG